MGINFRSAKIMAEYLRSPGPTVTVFFGLMVLMFGARFPIEVPGYVAPIVLEDMRIKNIEREEKSRQKMRMEIKDYRGFYLEEIQAIEASLAPCPRGEPACPSAYLLPIDRIDLERRLASVRRKLDNHLAFVAQIQGPAPEQWLMMGPTMMMGSAIGIFRVVAPSGLMLGILLLLADVMFYRKALIKYCRE